MKFSSQFLKKYGFALGLIIFTPLLLLLVSNEWLYPEIWTTDSYLNHSLALSYDLSDFQSWYYKSERVSWLIPLHYLMDLVGLSNTVPVWGMLSYFLLGTCFYGLLLEIYSSKKTLFFLPVVLLYPHLVSYSSGGGTYHNYITSFYFLVALIFWCKGVKHTFQKKRTVFFLLSGFFCFSTIISSLVFLNLLPLFFILEYHLNKKVTLKRYLWWLFGWVLAYLFWSVANFSFDRAWVSFALRLETLFSHSDPTHIYNSWFLPLSSGFFLEYNYARYLGLFEVAFFTSLFILWHRRREEVSKNILAYFCAFIVALWFFWQALGLQSLYPSDFSYPLQIPVFLTLPLFIKDEWINSLEGVFKHKLSPRLFVLGLWVSLFLANTCFYNIRYGHFGQEYKDSISFILLLVTVSSLCILQMKRNKLISLCLLFSLILFFGYFGDHYKSNSYKKCLTLAEADKTVVGIHNLIRWHQSDPRKIYFFFSPQEYFPLKKKFCSDQKFQVGMMIYHAGIVMGAQSFNRAGYEVLNQKDSLKNLDEDYFKRIYSEEALLVILSKRFDYYRENLLELARARGYQLIKIQDLNYPIFGNEVRGAIFKVKRL